MTSRRALAIGCGGTLGFAWTAVALAALEEALDWDARTADILMGTSAGSELVSVLGSGRRPADVVAALDGASDADPILARHVAHDPGLLPPLPRPGLPARGLVAHGLRERNLLPALAGLLPRGRGDATWLREFGTALADPSTGWVSHPATWLVAAEARTGRRVPLGAPGSPRVDLGTAISASWCIPGWFPPVSIDGRDHVDGGAVSSVSADLLLGHELDEVIVVAPMTSAGGVRAKGADRVERLLRHQMTAGLDREVKALEQAGVKVVRIEPTVADLDVMGPNFMDMRRREATVAKAKETTPAAVETALRAAGLTGAGR